VEHTEVGGTIDLGTSLVGDTLHLWVRDDGPGVALEDQERLFQRFARGDASGRRRTEGAGLGLAIVRAIAEAHGGRVLLDSRPGEGATFTIEVPAPPIAPDPTDPSTPEPAPVPLGPPTEELHGSHPDR
jgi:signal transduction histidine kinase